MYNNFIKKQKKLFDEKKNRDRYNMNKFRDNSPNNEFSYAETINWWGNIRKNDYVEYIGDNINIYWSEELLNTINNVINNDNSLKKELSILELGCNVGRNLDFIKKNLENCSVIGNDINKLAIENGKKIYDLDIIFNDTLSYMNDINNSDKVFDFIITCAHLIHIPHKECEEILKLIKKKSKYTILLEMVSDTNYSSGKDLFLRTYTIHFETTLINKKINIDGLPKYNLMVFKNY
jgi:SAM-dependent methyltransferase